MKPLWMSDKSELPGKDNNAPDCMRISGPDCPGESTFEGGRGYGVERDDIIHRDIRDGKEGSNHTVQDQWTAQAEYEDYKYYENGT